MVRCTQFLASPGSPAARPPARCAASGLRAARLAFTHNWRLGHAVSRIRLSHHIHRTRVATAFRIISWALLGFLLIVCPKNTRTNYQCIAWVWKSCGRGIYDLAATRHAGHAPACDTQGGRNGCVGSTHPSSSPEARAPRPGSPPVCQNRIRLPLKKSGFASAYSAK